MGGEGEGSLSSPLSHPSSVQHSSYGFFSTGRCITPLSSRCRSQPHSGSRPSTTIANARPARSTPVNHQNSRTPPASARATRHRSSPKSGMRTTSRSSLRLGLQPRYSLAHSGRPVIVHSSYSCRSSSSAISAAHPTHMSAAISTDLPSPTSNGASFLMPVTSAPHIAYESRGVPDTHATTWWG